MKVFYSLLFISLGAQAQIGRPSLEDFSKKLNNDLPEVYDPVTKLIRTTVENNNFVYNFIIDSDQKQYNWAMPKVKFQVLSTICRNQNQKKVLIDYRANIVYRYENVKGQSLGQFMIAPETCLKK